ncbi:ATP-binding cassette domain-containing protein [Qipengyuania soli]|uniref:ATP-binding cassette domain-containing protein n=1 Tax=Qipengyuania soli TaxID=2782568 RepID=A0A7S8ITU4_9SPHN|nr:ATP-binding cassette domain-containing protein [Qipengyuania soli]
MISVRNLHKSYPTRFGNKVVLDGIDFDLAPGERLGILGRNGAGKSTLIRLVSGAEKPTSGSIVRDMSVSWPLAFGGAFQPQLTGIDNIRFITSIYNQDFERNLAFVEEFAELGPYLREPVRSYSSGMRARLAFAISMIIEFDCFLIDEIGAVGDARFHDRCNRELFDVRGDRAMIIISHDAGYVREHCNRWAILHDAKLSLFEEFEEAYETYKELIGAETHSQPVPVDFTSRALMIASSQHAALTDERFRALVQQGDWARDERDWPRAADQYGKALALYPYQRSYWSQLGHMEKEQGNFGEAEIAYRTAVALGEPLSDVDEHAQFVMVRQDFQGGEGTLRVPQLGPAVIQPPARPDIELLSWLFTGDHKPEAEVVRSSMREDGTLDEVAANLVSGISFSAVHNKRDAQFEPLLERAICLLGDGRSILDRSSLEDGDDLPADLFRLGAFERWPLTNEAMSRRYPELAHSNDKMMAPSRSN